VQKAVQNDTGGLVFSGVAVGGLDLSQDLRLAHHHGIEAGGDPEDMADGIFAVVAVQVRLQVVVGDMVEICQKTADTGDSPGNVAGGGIDLHPVAGGDDDPLHDPFQGAELPQRFFDVVGRKGHFFPDIH